MKVFHNRFYFAKLEEAVARLEADDISLEDSCAIIESAAGFFDKELSQDDISEITTYLKEHKNTTSRPCS